MKISYQDTLNAITKILFEDKAIKEIIQKLKIKIQDSEEPFIWSVINIDSLQQNLPPKIKSIWVFVLKKNIPSIAHYHPNSIQHTIMVEGRGKIRISDNWEDLILFDSSKENTWYVINSNTPHEFYPEGQDMVVFSFHTCTYNKLIEIKCDSGEKRVYEK